MDPVRIHSETIGNGPTVLFTHGFGATSEMWRHQLGVLSEQHRVVTWDLRGHGRTRVPGDPSAYSQAAALADMATLLAGEEDRRAVLCGHSLGGYLSLAFHAAQPDRVAALILVATGPGYRDHAGRAKWNALAHRLARQIEASGKLDTAPGLGRPGPPEGLALAARGILPQADATVIDSLPTIRVPTLIVTGAQDRRFLDAATYMADKIPGATTATIEDAGHLPNLEQPAPFNRHLLDFLATL
jgi:pimeloyl-ACP methyl ester carboxylesterase